MSLNLTGKLNVSSGGLSVSTTPIITNDPFFNNVVLLLHMDGTDGGSTFIDNSQYNRTITRNGSANTSTDQIQFGTASCEINVGVTRSQANNLSFADDPIFTLGTQDFTIESWVYPTANTTLNQYFVLGTSTSTYLALGRASGVEAAIFRVFVSNNAQVALDGIDWTLNQWQHIAVTRSGNTFRLFQDGIETDSQITSHSIGDQTTNFIGRGTTSNDVNGAYVGYIDDLRFTIGTARYTENFSVPTMPFFDQ